MILELSIILAFLIVGTVGPFADRRWLGVPLGQLFWLGVGIGAIWEVPLYLMGPGHVSDPLWTMASPYPLHPLLLPITHAVLDGALFLLGVVLVQALTSQAIAPRFSGAWLGLFVGYGVIQAGSIEWLALSADAGWQYVPSRANPQLFTVNGKPFTALPILIWTIAPAVYYEIARRLAVDDQLLDNAVCRCGGSVTRQDDAAPSFSKL